MFRGDLSRPRKSTHIGDPSYEAFQLFTGSGRSPFFGTLQQILATVTVETTKPPLNLLVTVVKTFAVDGAGLAIGDSHY